MLYVFEKGCESHNVIVYSQLIQVVEIFLFFFSTSHRSPSRPTQRVRSHKLCDSRRGGFVGMTMDCVWVKQTLSIFMRLYIILYYTNCTHNNNNNHNDIQKAARRVVERNGFPHISSGRHSFWRK